MWGLLILCALLGSWKGPLDKPMISFELIITDFQKSISLMAIRKGSVGLVKHFHFQNHYNTPTNLQQIWYSNGLGRWDNFSLKIKIYDHLLQISLGKGNLSVFFMWGNMLGKWCNLPVYPTKTRVSGGETGIRTLGTRKGSTVFETVPFDHSGTSPRYFQAHLGGIGRRSKTEISAML